MSSLTHLECSACAQRLEPERPWQLCPTCEHPLLARYDLDGIGRAVARAELERRPAGMWRYRELLPLRDLGGARCRSASRPPRCCGSRGSPVASAWTACW